MSEEEITPDASLEPITVDPNEQPQAYVLGKFNNALAQAASTIVDAASKRGDVSRLHFDASKYLIEYVMGGGLGKSAEGSGASAEDILKQFRQDMDLLPDADKR